MDDRVLNVVEERGGRILEEGRVLHCNCIIMGRKARG